MHSAGKGEGFTPQSISASKCATSSTVHSGGLSSAKCSGRTSSVFEKRRQNKHGQKQDAFLLVDLFSLENV